MEALKTKQPFQISQNCRKWRPNRLICRKVYENRRYENDIGVHQLVWTGQLTPESAEKAFKGAKETGYDLIELNVSVPEEIDVKSTVPLLQKYGLKVSASMGLREDADISSTDNTVVSEGVDLLKQAVQCVSDLGGTMLCGVIYSPIKKFDQPISKQGYTNVVQSLKSVSSFAQDKGVTLGLEVINRYESNVLNTVGQGLKLCDDVGSDAVTLHLDVYHMNIEEPSMGGAIRAAGKKLGYLHIGESHRGYLGTGQIPFREIFNTLAEEKYTGPVVFESFSSEIVSPTLSSNLCIWRNLWSDSTELAGHARGYMHQHMQASHAASEFCV